MKNNKSFGTCLMLFLWVSSISSLFSQTTGTKRYVWIDEKTNEIAILKYGEPHPTVQYYSLDTKMETLHPKGNFNDAQLILQGKYANIKIANNILTVDGKAVDVTGFTDIMRCQNTNVYTAMFEGKLHYYTPKNGKFVPTFKKLKMEDFDKMYLETIKQYDKYDCHAVVHPDGNKMAFLVSYDFPRKESYPVLVVVDLLKNDFDVFKISGFFHGKSSKVINLIWEDNHKIVTIYDSWGITKITSYDIKAKKEVYEHRIPYNEVGQGLNNTLFYGYKKDYNFKKQFVEVDYIGNYKNSRLENLISMEENQEQIYKNSPAYKDSIRNAEELALLTEKNAYKNFIAQTDSLITSMQKDGISVVGQFANPVNLFKTDTTKMNQNKFDLQLNFHYILCKLDMKGVTYNNFPEFYLTVEQNAEYFNFITKTSSITEWNHSTLAYAKPFTTTVNYILKTKYYKNTLFNEKTMICLLAIPSQNWGTLAQKYFPKAVSEQPVELAVYEEKVWARIREERENSKAQAVVREQQTAERNKRSQEEAQRKNAAEKARVDQLNKRNADERTAEKNKSDATSKTNNTPQYKACSVCNGTGTKMCTYCGGQGRIYKTTARGSRESNYCTACSGGRKTCLGCGGSGKVKVH